MACEARLGLEQIMSLLFIGEQHRRNGLLTRSELKNHNRIYDTSSGLSYTGLVEIATRNTVSSLAQAGLAHGIGVPIFKGQWLSGLPH